MVDIATTLHVQRVIFCRLQHIKTLVCHNFTLYIDAVTSTVIKLQNSAGYVLFMGNPSYFPRYYGNCKYYPNCLKARGRIVINHRQVLEKTALLFLSHLSSRECLTRPIWLVCEDNTMQL